MREVRDTDDFINSLPSVSPDESFCFSCSRSLDCFNQCCGDITLSLSPYDVIRLRFALGIGSKVFFDEYATLSAMPGNGFPAIFMKMLADEAESCPFVAKSGCVVYAHRPGACRVYPLGRGASIDENGDIEEQYIMVREPHCLGIGADQSWTIDEYLDRQGMTTYIGFDDKYMRLLNRWNQKGMPLNRDQFSYVLVAMYRPDELARFIGQESLMSLLVPKGGDQLAYETEIYLFGLDWLHAVLLGGVSK